MRDWITLVEKAQKTRTADDLEDYDGDAIKDGCTKKVPEEVAFADFAYVWWVGGTQKEMEGKRKAFIAAEKKLKKERVKHADMTTGQLCVNPDKVAALLDNPTDKRPVIHRWNGYNILFDGNHRVTADVLRGDKASDCLVMNLNPYFDKKGCLKKQ